jgi:hypothetical protein
MGLRRSRRRQEDHRTADRGDAIERAGIYVKRTKQERYAAMVGIG